MAIISDSGADVALSPLNMAGHGEGELGFHLATKLQDALMDAKCVSKRMRSSVQKEISPHFAMED